MDVRTIRHLLDGVGLAMDDVSEAVGDGEEGGGGEGDAEAGVPARGEKWSARWLASGREESGGAGRAEEESVRGGSESRVGVLGVDQGKLRGRSGGRDLRSDGRDQPEGEEGGEHLETVRAEGA